MGVTRLTIAHVTPYAWDPSPQAPGAAGEVNRAVARTSYRLAERGHRVLVIAPSTSADAVRMTRRAIRSGADLFDPDGGVAVLQVGEVLPPPGTVRRVAGLPVDVTRTVEELLGHVSLDVCHVHEPFGPSVSSTALRHSRALNVGTFHAPTERLVATQVDEEADRADLRPARRPAGELQGHRRPHGAPLPRRLRGGLPGSGSGSGRSHAPGNLRRRSGPTRLRRRGGTRSAARLPPRAAAPGRRTDGATVGGRRGQHARSVVVAPRCATSCASGCASPTEPPSTRSWPAPTSSSAPVTARPPPRTAAARPRGRRGPGGRPSAGLRGAGRRWSGPALRAPRRRDARCAAAAPDLRRRRSCTAADRRRPAAGTGALGARDRRPRGASTRAVAAAGTTRRATRRSAGG